MKTARAKQVASSPDGCYIASLQSSSLVVRSLSTGATLCNFEMASGIKPGQAHIVWHESSTGKGSGRANVASSRILVADDENVHVFAPDEPDFKARVPPSQHGISTAFFGFNPDDIIVCTNFGLKLTIWSLLNGRGKEIPCPKIVSQPGGLRSTRTDTRYIALSSEDDRVAVLSRPTANDILLILERSNEGYEVVNSTELPTTDAQEIAWSPSGHWLAVRETPSQNSSVSVLTADGQLFRTWRSRRTDENQIDLGIKTIQWGHTAAGMEVLALGDNHDEITFLGRPNLAQLATLRHVLPRPATQVQRWMETVDKDRLRSYSEAPSSIELSPAMHSTKSNVPRHGVSLMRFSPDGSMLASKTDLHPTAVWIWSLESGTLLSISIHHSPIREMEWHQSQRDLLLIHCFIEDPVVHLWKSSWPMPVALAIPVQASGSSPSEATWLRQTNNAAETVTILLTWGQSYATLDINPTDGAPAMCKSSLFASDSPKCESAFKSIGHGPEVLFDEGHSLDLSPIKISDEVYRVSDADAGQHAATASTSTEAGDYIDDTFVFHKRAGANRGMVPTA